MTKEEIARIRKHIEIHARQERRAVIITEVLRKAVNELEHVAELEKENARLRDGIALKDEEVGCIETDFNTFKSKAKEIIKNLMKFAEIDCREYEEAYKEAEQFVKE